MQDLNDYLRMKWDVQATLITAEDMSDELRGMLENMVTFCERKITECKQDIIAQN